MNTFIIQHITAPPYTTPRPTPRPTPHLVPPPALHHTSPHPPGAPRWPPVSPPPAAVACLGPPSGDSPVSPSPPPVPPSPVAPVSVALPARDEVSLAPRVSGTPLLADCGEIWWCNYCLLNIRQKLASSWPFSDTCIHRHLTVV